MNARLTQTLIQISVKGARHNNEDTSFGDGRLFAVFDGHGGKYASQLLRKKVAHTLISSSHRSMLASLLLLSGTIGANSCCQTACIWL